MKKTLLILTICSASSCASPSTFHGTWAGDSKRQSIRRAQDGTEILCSDPKFDEMKCGKGEDWWAVKNSCHEQK